MLTKIFSPLWIIGAAGNIVAVTAVAGLIAMVALGVRLPAIERRIGLDRVYQFHKILGPAVVLLFIAHGILRTLHHSLQHGGTWNWSFLFYFGVQNLPLLFGHLAIYSLVIIATIALLGRHRIPFRLWKDVHFLVYPTVAVAFLHVFLESSRGLDSTRSFAILLLLVVPLSGLYFYRWWYAVRRERNGTWVVSQLVRETRDTTTLVVSRPDGPGKFGERRAGQFAIIRVLEGNRWSDPHPFTISAAPSSPNLTFTIKSAGRFTSAVPSLAPGTAVLCEGPYGVFNVDFSNERDVVMICGGVGITPFLSNIRHAVAIKADARITLLCGNRNIEDIIAMEDLNAAVEHIQLRVVHVLSKPPQSGLPASSDRIIYEAGHINGEILSRYVTSSKVSFYLCGPEKMQEAVLLALQKTLSVPRSAVRREMFFY